MAKDQAENQKTFAGKPKQDESNRSKIPIIQHVGGSRLREMKSQIILHEVEQDQIGSNLEGV